MRKVLFSITMLFVLFTNLTASSFDKQIQGNWYYHISIPLDKTITMHINGNVNYMFNHKASVLINISFKENSGLESPVFLVNAMEKWEIQNNILLEEILQSDVIVDKIVLKQNPELKEFKDLLEKICVKGLANTSKIKSIKNDTMIIDVDGTEIIATRKPPFKLNITNHINKR